MSGSILGWAAAAREGQAAIRAGEGVAAAPENMQKLRRMCEAGPKDTSKPEAGLMRARSNSKAEAGFRRVPQKHQKLRGGQHRGGKTHKKLGGFEAGPPKTSKPEAGFSWAPQNLKRRGGKTRKN